MVSDPEKLVTSTFPDPGHPQLILHNCHHSTSTSSLTLNKKEKYRVPWSYINCESSARPPFPAWKEKRTLPALRNPTNKQCHCRSPGDSESLAFHLDQPLGKQVKSTWWWWYTIQDTRLTGPWIKLWFRGRCPACCDRRQSSLSFGEIHDHGKWVRTRLWVKTNKHL